MGDDLDLISKKELLDQTGISYGQLYRWKRKGLIPESWFIKKSAFTGQETFFPRSEMLERVDRIKGMKDDLALDELADILAPAPATFQISMDDLQSRNIVSKETLDLIFESLSLSDPLEFKTALNGWIVDRHLKSGDLGIDEAKLLLASIQRTDFPEQQGQFLFLRKRGVGFCLTLSGTGRIHPDPEAKIVAQGDILALVGEFRIALNGGRP